MNWGRGNTRRRDGNRKKSELDTEREKGTKESVIFKFTISQLLEETGLTYTIIDHQHIKKIYNQTAQTSLEHLISPVINVLFLSLRINFTLCSSSCLLNNTMINTVN